MNVTINEKEYPLHIGLAFIRELDRKYIHTFGAIQFGFGVGKMLLYLTQFDAPALADFILAGTITHPNPPSPAEVDAFIESRSAEEIVSMCENFMMGLEESSTTKPQVAQLGAMARMVELTNVLKDELPNNSTSD